MSVELSGAHRFSNVIGQAVQTPVQAHILGRVLFSVYSSGSGRVAAALPKTHSVCKSNRGGFLIMQTTCTALREMSADGALFKVIPTAPLWPKGATYIETPFSAPKYVLSESWMIMPRMFPSVATRGEMR